MGLLNISRVLSVITCSLFLINCQGKVFDPNVFLFGSDLHTLKAARAIYEGDCEQLSRMLEDGLSPDASGKGNVSVLLWSMELERKDCFSILLSKGAHFNLPVAGYTEGVHVYRGWPREYREPWGGDGETVLQLSLNRDDPWYLSELLKAGGDPNFVDTFDGSSLIIKAAKTGNLVALEVLLNAGADLYYVDEWNEDAMMAALKAGEYDIATRLLDLGYDFELSNKSVKEVYEHEKNSVIPNLLKPQWDTFLLRLENYMNQMEE